MKKKSYIIDNKLLMSEWDYEKNKDLDPNKLTDGSDKKAWWKCSKCNYMWETRIRSRAKKHTDCPRCYSNFVVTQGINDLATTYPKIAKEWHPTKNGNLTPDNVRFGSSKKVWWLCSKCGYEWNTGIYNRTTGKNGCPLCKHSVLVPGKNDLSTTYPEVAKEWNKDRNRNLKPTNIMPGSHKKVWWTCSKCGYEWTATVNNRTGKHSGCPKCTKSSSKISGLTSLDVTHPKIAKEWHPTKNGSLTSADVKAGSSKKVWWVCNICHHEYEATVYSRTKGSGCVHCLHTNKTSYPEQAIFYYIKQIYPDAINGYKSKFLGRLELDIFIPSINFAIEYDGKAWHKENFIKREQKKYLICQKHNIKLIRVREKISKLGSDIADREFEVVKLNNKPNLEETIKLLLKYINFSKKYIDINLNNDENTIREGYHSKPKDSLYNLFPEIAKEWHPTKNGNLTPDQFKNGSDYKAWWKCAKCGHEWKTSIKHRAKRKHNCPLCSNQVLIQGINDLATTHPNLAREWHPTKNGNLTPRGIITAAGKKFWWKCPDCGYDYQATIVHRKFSKSGCPNCYGNHTLSGKNDLVTTHPEIARDWHPTKNGTLKPTALKAGSHKIVWWKCSKCGYEFKSEIRKYVENHKCSNCERKKSKQLYLFDV